MTPATTCSTSATSTATSTGWSSTSPLTMTTRCSRSRRTFCLPLENELPHVSQHCVDRRPLASHLEDVTILPSLPAAFPDTPAVSDQLTAATASPFPCRSTSQTTRRPRCL
ncbi:hypothetical protein FJT64_007726 [Amphibalanus amphitrite]|uniref:Uncharacterized protein n=1 Tax=Amphibalanus amphitrite TaxID=1232801 RepID=A0A6A4VXN8_AMPAM|nr:hypothetical protein FJT64_007726 [Amphibalanus amphitrite]